MIYFHNFCLLFRLSIIPKISIPIASNEVISNNQPRYSVRRDGTLTINNAQTRDVGYYECRANNSMGQAVSRRAQVSMHSAPQGEGP